MTRYSVAVGLTLLVVLAATVGAVEVVFVHSAPGAGEVHLAGSFNGWNAFEHVMEKQGGRWVATLDLDQGSHQYKFVVDGAWAQDPSNPNATDDGYGGQNSVVEVSADATGPISANGKSLDDIEAPRAAVAASPGAIGSGTEFRCAAPGAGAVFVAGEFNDWNPTSDRLADGDGDGVFTATLPLAAGRFQYKFVVDGNWLVDPAAIETADDGFGGQNSVLTVGDGAAVSVVAIATAAQPAADQGDILVTFRFTPVISGVSSVTVAGSFNGWDPAAHPMTDPEEDGTYETVVNLARGEHQYKFVVDGEWHADPNNSNTSDDGLGGQNSVVNVRAGDAAIDAASTTSTGAGAVGLRTVPFSYAGGSSSSNVFLAGSFNDWNDSKQKMSDADGDGVFETTLLLEPGSYQYKFVIDGNWKHDPVNPNGVEDGFGGQNSVLEVDDSFSTVAIERGDGRFFVDDIEPIFDYSTCNPLTPTSIEIAARAHLNDVDGVWLRWRIGDGDWATTAMDATESDPSHQRYRIRIDLGDASDVLEYTYVYRDGDKSTVLGTNGFTSEDKALPFRYTQVSHPPFLTPDWAKDGIVYQIFPERFRNGDKDNDPDFSEPWYQGANTLPPSGKINGEYFHMVDDWTDVAGLTRSPFRTDGKPDYFSFYGGDIAGVNEKLDYLNDLGITVIYFNPLNQGMSNHKYDPTDYNTVDPHFATEDEFKAFVKNAHDHGIRIVVDVAFNHTGNWHFAFRDGVEKGRDSEYWNWYEWSKWPLPTNRDFNASDYYDCWWGFGLHPNLNWDLKRPNNAENGIADMADASPNMAVVDHVLGVASYWLGDLDIDGFRLDVPNEVPFWFWKEFNRVCKEIKPDSWLVGEIWGNAGSWIGPDCFDSTMNYKYFRDPVMEFFGQGRIDAATFERRLAPGRTNYPPQSVQVMMNLIDSHDTIRFLTSVKDVKRLQMAAMFSMSYVGMPHIWYGDEVGMTGGKDPDCRRPMDWNYTDDARKVALRDYYGTITRYRRDSQVLSRGDYRTVQANGRTLAFARTLGSKAVVSLFNTAPQAVTMTLTADELATALPAGASTVYKVIAGSDWFDGMEGGTLISGKTVDLGNGDVTIVLPGLSGVMLGN